MDEIRVETLREALKENCDVQCETQEFEVLFDKKRVTVVVQDFGADHPGGRYAVAVEHDGRTVTQTNTANDLKEACAQIKWLEVTSALEGH
jgi:hypothetical protein